jgi:hypothetical protein
MREKEGSDGGAGGSFWTEQRENKGRGVPAWCATWRGRGGGPVVRHALEQGPWRPAAAGMSVGR